ncbi:hypothetical protein OKW41_000175 [Paraburkholderia sp. UCT70]
MLYAEDGSVKGVITGNMGVGNDGEPTENFQLGMELHAKYTLFCEGARGHLGRELMDKFKLRQKSDPQVYGIGIKELCEIDPVKHKPGLVIHTAGWPLDPDTAVLCGTNPARQRLHRNRQLICGFEHAEAIGRYQLYCFFMKFLYAPLGIRFINASTPQFYGMLASTFFDRPLARRD